MIKPLSKLGIEGNVLNMTEGIYEKPTANIFNGERMKVFSTKIRDKTRNAHFHYCYSSLSWRSQLEQLSKKRIEGIQIEKEKLKLSVFGCDMIYVENPIASTKKVLELIKEFSKSCRYEIKTQKSVVFLYPVNE